MARQKILLEPGELKQIETMAGLGITVAQISAVLGMSKKTFERRMKDTPGANDALEKGRASAALNVTKTAYTLATSGKVPAMTMFWLKCRERWREVQVHEHSGPDGKPIKTVDESALSDEELDAKIAEKLAKAGKA